MIDLAPLLSIDHVKAVAFNFAGGAFSAGMIVGCAMVTFAKEECPLAMSDAIAVLAIKCFGEDLFSTSNLEQGLLGLGVSTHAIVDRDVWADAAAKEVHAGDVLGDSVVFFEHFAQGGQWGCWSRVLWFQGPCFICGFLLIEGSCFISSRFLGAVCRALQ